LATAPRGLVAFQALLLAVVFVFRGYRTQCLDLPTLFLGFQ